MHETKSTTFAVLEAGFQEVGRFDLATPFISESIWDI